MSIKWIVVVAAIFSFWGNSIAQYSIERSDGYAYVLDSSNKKLDSLRIPKMTPDIKFGVDSTIVLSVHSTGDTLNNTDKGFMFMFYSIKNNKLEELFNYPITAQDAEEIKKMDIKLGQSSILLNIGNIYSNTYKISIRSRIRRLELLKIIKQMGIK